MGGNVYSLILLLFVSIVCSQTCEESQIHVSKSLFDSAIKQYYYASEDQQNIYVLTSAGTVYQSTDRGVTFLNKMSHFTGWNNASLAFPYGKTGVRRIRGAGRDNIVYFEGYHLSYWVTRGDDIFKLYNLGTCDENNQVTGDYLQRLYPSPYDASSVFRIVADEICFSSNFEQCFQKLEVSVMHEGAIGSWVQINDYTFKATWGNNQDQILYSTVEEENRISNQLNFPTLGAEKELVVTSEYGQEVVERVPSVVDFALVDGAIYFLKYSDEETLTAYVSQGVFEATEMVFAGASNVNFTDIHTAQTYSILGGSDDVNFIAVHLPDGYANLYQSVTADSSYWISLPYIRESGQGTDFYKAEDLPGVYAANRYNIEHVLDENREDYVETVISFDEGSQWMRLDSIDNPNDNVNLFLSEEYTGQGTLSSEQAAGIMYSLGNEGDFRLAPTEDIGLYLSRTGGKKWERVLNGHHLFSFNDHASLITATAAQQDTSTLLFSWDQGLTWESCSWGELEPFTVISIIPLTNYPNGLQYLLLGQFPNGQGVVMSVDFLDSIPSICGEDDFESFEPVVGNVCLLGRSTRYLRRKRDAVCVAPGVEQQQGETYNCACTRLDFQCDGACFQEVHTDDVFETICYNICEGTENDPQLPPENCNGQYYRTQGYQKIPDDTCIGGAEYLPVLTPCPVTPTSSPSTEPSPPPTVSATSSPESSPNASPSASNEASQTPSNSWSSSQSPTPTLSYSSSPSLSSGASPSNSASETPSNSASATISNSASATQSQSNSASETSSPSSVPSIPGKSDSPSPSVSLVKTPVTSPSISKTSEYESSGESSGDESSEEDTNGIPIPLTIGVSVAVGFIGVVLICCIGVVVVIVKRKKTGKSRAARLEEEDVFSLEDNDEWEL